MPLIQESEKNNCKVLHKCWIALYSLECIGHNAVNGATKWSRGTIVDSDWKQDTVLCSVKYEVFITL